MMEAKQYYEAIKDKGELNDILPNASGEWEIDKSRFIKHYNENIKLVNDFENGNLDLTIDEYEDYDFEEDYD